MKSRLKSKLEEIVGLGRKIGDSIFKQRESFVIVILALPLIINSSAYSSRGKLGIHNRISYQYTSAHVSILHWDMEGVTEGVDQYDFIYGAMFDPSGIAAKIVSKVDGFELDVDSRPVDSTSSVSLELALVSQSGNPITISSENEINVNFPLGEEWDFGTIRIYLTVDGVTYDVRQLVSDGGVIKLADLNGTYNSEEVYNTIQITFETPPPEVDTLPATDIRDNSARLKGKIIDDGEEDCEYRFSYWKDGGSIAMTDWRGQVNAGEEFSQYIYGLDTVSTYYFRAEARNSGGSSQGDVESFVTSYQLPEVDTLSAVDIGENTAKLKGKIIYDGGEECGYRFSYWKEGGSITTTAWSYYVETEEEFIEYIFNLVPGSIYYFRAEAINSAGSSEGDLESFVTAGAVPPESPVVETLSATDIGQNSATLTGKLIEDGGAACEYRFSYWISGESTQTTGWVGSVYEGSTFSASVSGLISDTLYYFVAEARNSTGESSGGSKSFNTLSSGSGEPDEPDEPNQLESENLLTIEYTNNQVSKVWNLSLKDGAVDGLDENDVLSNTSENEPRIFSLISDNNLLYESSFDARPKNTNEPVYLEVNSSISPESKLKLRLKGFEDKNLTIQRLNPNDPNDFSYLAYDVKDLVNNEEKTGIIKLFDPNNPEQTVFPFILDFNSRIAYFPLDETEGNIAEEKINNLNGTVIGNANWQPNSGKINGALLFDGTGNYISAPFILNPAEGPFSAYAWIKNGLPNQSIISQSNINPRLGIGQTWLKLSPEGKLVTGLKDDQAKDLVSQGPGIIDNLWHHVGVVWDGSKRYLYLDGEQVAKDNENLSQLTGSQGELYFGAGKNLESKSLFSGMIDNVRIYNLPLRDIIYTEKGSFEGFESGDFSKFEWGNTSPVSWKIDSEDPYSGNYCAKAVNTHKGDNTKLRLTIPCKDGEISFYRKLNSSYYRGLMFYIDDQMVDSWGGKQDWEKFSYPVKEGTREFIWFYKQDQEITEGEAAWIDDITFPEQY